jgi:hypothetical protein
VNLNRSFAALRVQANTTYVELNRLEVVDARVIALFTCAAVPTSNFGNGSVAACIGTLPGTTCTPVSCEVLFDFGLTLR